jgi:hypothetical protein
MPGWSGLFQFRRSYSSFGQVSPGFEWLYKVRQSNDR